MSIFLAIFFLMLGAVAGSFVGALTWRLKQKLDWVKGRSVCEHCKHQLGVGDLVPIVSWLALRGKCRYCRKPIGWLAFGLEVGVAAAFGLSYLLWPLGNIVVGGNLDLGQFGLLAIWLVMVVLMAALFVYDARWRLLPNKLLWPLVGVAAVFAILSNVMVGRLGPVDFLTQISAALLPVTGVYGILYLLSRGKWIGLGDVKFGLVVGLLLNFWGAVLVLIGANLIGVLVMLPGLIGRKLNLNSKIPFGPFLILATFWTFLFLGQLTDLIRCGDIFII